jgi:hypothetical protein
MVSGSMFGWNVEWLAASSGTQKTFYRREGGLRY